MKSQACLWLQLLNLKDLPLISTLEISGFLVFAPLQFGAQTISACTPRDGAPAPQICY
jgi:hypothetical protein